MKQSKTTLKELTHRYRAVLLKCALLNLAAFAVALPASAADIVIGDGDTVTYTRIKQDYPDHYTIKVNDNAEKIFNDYSADLKMTGGNLVIESKVGDWLDWIGNDLNISGGTVSAKNEETLSTYSNDGATLSISGNAVIKTGMMSDRFAAISGGKITLADTEYTEYGEELAHSKGVGVSTDVHKADGTVSISDGDITLGKNRGIVLVRSWGYDDSDNSNTPPSSYQGDIKISGGNITLNQNAQIIRTDNYDDEDGSITYLKDSRPNELSKTTGEINISGGTVTLNDTAAIINHSYDGTIRVSDTAVLNINGNNRFENAKGIATADFTGGTINLNGTLTANINATGGSLTVNKGGNLNGKLSGTLNDLTISGGSFNDISFETAGSKGITVSGGTFDNGALIAKNSGTLTITGGSFKDNTLEGKNIAISGGIFNNWMNIDASKEYADSGKLNITGGDFSKLTFLEMYGKNITIDSDKANFTLSANRMANEIDSSNKLTATGSKGISVAKTIVSSPEFSGKIIANRDAFVGGFGSSLDNWEGYYRISQDAFGIDTKLNNANITLNADAKVGTGDIIWGINSLRGRFDSNANVTLRLNGQKQLSDAEINIAVNEILTDLKRVEAGTKDIDDLNMFTSDAIEVPYSGTLEYYQEPELQSYIQEQWEQHKELNYALVENTLRDAYAAYNGKVSEFSAQVKVVNSAITMNGASGLVNGSAKDGNIVVSDNSTVVANGTNEITAKSGTVSFANSKLIVSNGANLTVATKDGNTLNLTNGTVDLSGVLNGNVSGGTLAFNSANARLNGKIANTGVEINTDIGFSALPTGLTTLKIATGKTLDIGENSLTASTIAGGTISAILTDAAKNTAIVTATATDVTLKLDMSQASRDKATRYKITNGTGFTFGDYATNRYAVSASEFDKTNAETLEKLSGWNGGDLWILRLATASEAAIEDLEKSGVVLPENEKNASKILDLAAGILDKLPEHRKKVIEKVNDLLDKAQGKAEEIKQILREIAPDASTSGSKTASNTAKSVINVINSRFGGGLPRRGRSGGDYTAGQTAVWAQGMMNYAKLDTDNGFAAHSNGVAAGFEANFTDSFKAGLGYAYTSTDISTERSTTDVKTHTGFVYGEYKPNKAYINGVVSFGRSDYDDTTRSLSLNSAYKTDTIAAQIAAGYKAGVLTPEAAVRFTNVKQKAYTDALGAKMEEKTADTWTGVLGAKIGQNYMLKANRKIGLSPELKVAATYDFARDDENRTVTLPDGSSYTATGEAMERFGVEAGAGVTVSIANSAEIALTYDGKFKKDYQDHTGMVNLKIKF